MTAIDKRYVGDRLTVTGARQHNLKGVDLSVPKNKLVVFCGVSGSGKSSLAFDTLYAEGQRRYVESLSAYARQFLGQMDKPVYDHIRGLSPTIAIDQKTTGSNPRSTVGTITEIYDYLRVLYARAGQQHCHACGAVVGTQEPAQIVSDLLALPEGTRLLVLAPLARGRKGTFADTFADALKGGYLRVRIDGEVRRLEPELALDKQKKHDVDLVIDRVVIRSSDRLRLTDSVETALKAGKGQCAVAVVRKKGEDPGEKPLPFEEKAYSEALYCDTCDISYPPLTPQRFSFNTPQGACQTCNGLGIALKADPDRVIPDDTLTVRGGAIAPWAKQVENNSWTRRLLEALERDYKVDLDTPWKDLSKRDRKLLMYGAKKKVKVKLDGNNGKGEWAMRFEGILNQIERRWKETASAQMRDHYRTFFVEQICPGCDGARMRKESAAVQLAGQVLPHLSAMPVADLTTWFGQLALEGSKAAIAKELIKEIRARLGFLSDVGLGYLSLGRAGQTLSGGEAQRIRLASQVGSELTGVLYILDEPSIGLHPRDTRRLLTTLEHLRAIGNSVLVVEHDEETIRAADHIVDFGPRAGIQGGEVVAEGSVADVMASPRSLTGDWLAGRRTMPQRTERRTAAGWIHLRGARANNLQGVDVDLPTGCFSVVTGVSGAGKSSLISGTLLPALANALHKSERRVGAHDAISGLDAIDKVIEVDQRPIGRTPRSNPATYTKVWDKIRAVFATLPDAKVAGYSAGRFSFNVKGGRCEHCKGDGLLKIEMHFLADVYVPCDVCEGRRFNDATLQVRYKGYSIADVLGLSIDEGVELFTNHRHIRRILETLQRVGLGYLHLGQTAPTLSGGEAQRVKLARELARADRGHTLYVLDEPTTGLHFEDVCKLLAVLQELVDRGNSVLVVEHNLDLIRVADHVIDLGPEGGQAGGLVVAVGTPEEIMACEQSHTGRALRGQA
ncbi:MAG: excinuclease ABC subunit UvrA [Myxococcales bacterium]|nr:excinuclease ABC subunit UvrA [Myxococcales bacterium]